MTFQERPSNGSRDAAEKLVCPPSKVRLNVAWLRLTLQRTQGVC